ncbi:MAG: hypothetical protein F6K10_10995 [Moorea sp. SIO2B7]|nr:hypothetical protein [Moorena sp. SIO2B7]
MTYSIYLRRTLISFLICCFIFLAAVSCQIGVVVGDWSQRIVDLYEIKSGIAEATESPKLVIISGSNGLLGISCKIIHEETGVSCVNGATNAVIGIDYILSRARSWLNPGDTVLMPLEFHHYQYDGVPNKQYINYIFSRDPKYLLSVDWLTKIRFFMGISWERLQLGIEKKINPRPPDGRVYKTLNQYGDETKLSEAKMTAKEINKVAAETPLEIGGYIKSSYGMRSIKTFLKWCKENKVQVIATWPNTIWFEVYKYKKYQIFFKSIEDFYEKFDVPMVGQYRDSMYNKSMFYDSKYHLHDRGVRHRTKKLIELLRPYL